MFSHASLTVRLAGLPDNITRDFLERRAQDACHADTKMLSFFRRPQHAQQFPLRLSLSSQGDTRMATVTFPLGKSKERALKSLADWQVDDTFAGVTVLHSSTEPDLDICAVHGLNGNAFDTWAWEGSDMWLRDFLPEPRPTLHPGLARLRVMTFGYSSLVRDNTNTTGLYEWSSELLQSVSRMRRSDSVGARCLFRCLLPWP
ncbi:hypothetical protein SPI_05919 [Niveomyces insectorum RCEF 264]|uniref:Uncharacterized protein n=1 Tax=Niveomyces insectorum RCEF 264 TaxID=1081102 RepID=A0A167SL29_9HYPO|nr:hypothetical protein SPI_05919 [Niveomyces insectorum RCEF 264]